MLNEEIEIKLINNSLTIKSNNMAKLARTKKIKTPEELQQLFNEYEAWTKSNPYKVQDFVGSMAKEVTRENKRPLTMTGFKVFVNDKGVAADLRQYFANRNNAYEDFASVCDGIKDAIADDQIIGAMLGIYNVSITQRIIGLAAKKQINSNIETTVIIKREPIKIITQSTKLKN